MTNEKEYFLVDCPELTPLERTMGRVAASQAFLSTDTTKVGSAIFRDGRVLSLGYNRLSEGVSIDNFFITEDNKNIFTLHSEIDAITFAARKGNSLEGATIIIAGKCPCCECAKAIIAAGIVKVICPIPDKNSRWVETNGVALRLLRASDIEVQLVEELSGATIGLTCPSKYIV